jgi:hypothetical protein
VNVEEVVRETLHDIAREELPATPPDYADRLLRTRRRRRAGGVTALAVALAAVLTASVAVPALTGDDRGGQADRTASAQDVLAHPHQSPPRDLIAAGQTAMSAFTVTVKDKQPNGDVVVRDRWHLYNPATGRYRATDWRWADVAPGLEKAAVLEGPLPQPRVGILDLASGKVTRWIDLPKGAGSVYWSPDGDQLLLTTYSKDPDRRFANHPENLNGKEQPGQVPSRTGFEVVDVASGTAHWHAMPPYKDPKNPFPPMYSRDDLKWSWDGSLIWEHSPFMPPKHFFDLDGDKVTAPVGENYAYSQAGRSPDGRYAAGDFAGSGNKTATAVLDARTGKPVAKQPVQELLAWADGHRLIAWGCGPGRCSGKGEFHQQLLLVDVQGKHVQQLSSFRTSGKQGSWEPHFSRR